MTFEELNFTIGTQRRYISHRSHIVVVFELTSFPLFSRTQVRLQTQSHLYRGVTNCFMTIVHKEGVSDATNFRSTLV